MRILVTGSRTWTDEDTVWSVLDILTKEAMAAGDTVTLVHGACPQGGDEIAERWYRARRPLFLGDLTAERHPADWQRYGGRAGILRNQAMVDRGAHICLAFIADGSRGASHCADLAERAGITVRRFETSSEATP